jgi:hypothetical protein
MKLKPRHFVLLILFVILIALIAAFVYIDNEIKKAEKQSQLKQRNQTLLTQPDCLSIYNLTPHTVIFYYQNEPHSNAMLPLVQKLQANYSFYLTQEIWNKKFNSCFGLTGTTPTFVCAGTLEKLTGEQSKEALKAFVEHC